jgi:hypothetical protein
MKANTCSVPRCKAVGPVTWLCDVAGEWFAFCSVCAPVYKAGGYRESDE